MCFAWLGMEAVGLRLCILVNIPQLYHHLAPALLLFSSVKLKPNSPIVPIHAQVVPLVEVNLAESLYCVYTLMYLRICIFTFKLSLLNIQHDILYLNSYNNRFYQSYKRIERFHATWLLDVFGSLNLNSYTVSSSRKALPGCSTRRRQDQCRSQV